MAAWEGYGSSERLGAETTLDQPHELPCIVVRVESRLVLEFLGKIIVQHQVEGGTRKAKGLVPTFGESFLLLALIHTTGW